jgi:hypothetical protein
MDAQKINDNEIRSLFICDLLFKSSFRERVSTILLCKNAKNNSKNKP